MTREHARFSPEQDLLLDLIELGSFNGFDGPAVVAALRANARLWEAVVPSDERGGAIALRDLPDEYNLSSLFIRSSGDDGALAKLMRDMGANEVDWADEKPAGTTFSPWKPSRQSGKRVLRAWWD